MTHRIGFVEEVLIPLQALQVLRGACVEVDKIRGPHVRLEGVVMTREGADVDMELVLEPRRETQAHTV